MHILFLASKSFSRKILLEQAHIPFKVIDQDADEALCDWNVSLSDAVLSIARFKMQHAIVPKPKQDNEICFVLTADTLLEDYNGHKHGKPVDKADAINKLKLLAPGAFLATGFCVYKYISKNDTWLLLDKVEQVVMAEYQLQVPDYWLEQYLSSADVLSCAGAHYGEGFGMQFVKYIKGSYSGVFGLPLFELRESLERLGFYNK